MFKLTHVFTTNVIKMCNVTLLEQNKNLLSVLVNMRNLIWCSALYFGQSWILIHLFDHSQCVYFDYYVLFLFDPNVHGKKTHIRMKMDTQKWWDVGDDTMSFIVICLVHTRCDSKFLGVVIQRFFFNPGTKNPIPWCVLCIKYFHLFVFWLPRKLRMEFLS